ncbi:HAD hydrolase-like protein [Pseudonocardia sp. RS010]|uniref:HAD hydrolase-like protein n=1 Tax=Pseudonocardia sp. RS010 TaxID=3385979 RepID=UPI0039A015B0
MTRPRYRTVLLDLDGTLVDSAPGILGTLRTAFEQVGVPYDDTVIGPHLLGPPLYESLPPLVGAGNSERILALYRPLYRESGLLKSTPYPGIEDLLQALVAAGVRLGLATSKAEPAAREILANQGWTELFTAITGDTVDARRPSKAAVVAEALRRLDSPAPAETIMIGDRLHDVVGSGRHGISCLGAGWGYGEPGELETAGAVAVHDSATDLQRALLS